MLQRDRLAMATIRRCTASCFLTQIVIEFVIYLNETNSLLSLLCYCNGTKGIFSGICILI